MYLTTMRELRKAKGLTAKALSEIVGTSEGSISNYENGKREPDMATLCAIADALDVSLDMLVRGKEKDRPEGRSMDDVIKRFQNYSPVELRELGSLINYLQYRKEREQSEGRAKEDTP